MRWCLFLGLWLVSPLAWGQGLLPPPAQPSIFPLIFCSAVLGALLFITLFTTAQYLLNRDAPTGWYALYLATDAIWFWQANHLWANVIPQLTDSTAVDTFMLILVYGMKVSYLRFMSYLLEVPQRQPRLERWIHYFFWYAILAVLASLTGIYGWQSKRLYELTNFIGYAALLFLLITMLRGRHPLRNYAVAGSVLLVCGSLAAAYLNFSGVASTSQLLRMPLFYVSLGILLEILCFSLALGQRFYLNKVEKIQAQQQLIQQLEENGRLQQTYTSELERQLDQRTTEILAKAHELEEQRVTQLQSDFVRRIAEAEMAGLRSQMNPHFIFNCLNSIKLYATENDSGKASEYLTKFSRLIRLVLENSRSERVTLQNELNMIQLYADMEIMRFKQKLAFSVTVEADIDTRFIEIPPLLLQPYVENAIWHGLMHKPEGGSVSVRVTLPQDDLLQLAIADDGVGRAKAAELKSKSANHRKSFGLKMTSERISLVNQLYQTHTQVTIHDLVDAGGQSAGTEVVLQIPI